MNDSFLLYRASSTDGATHLDLIIAVYDALAQDLNRIGEAAATAQIESRCTLSRHAFLLLGYLEIWLAELKEPALERSLSTFYSFLRAELMRLQTSKDRAAFASLAMLVCETRAAWQQKRMQASSPSQMPTSSQVPSSSSGLQGTSASSESPRMGWSA